MLKEEASRLYVEHDFIQVFERIMALHESLDGLIKSDYRRLYASIPSGNKVPNSVATFLRRLGLPKSDIAAGRLRRRETFPL